MRLEGSNSFFERVERNAPANAQGEREIHTVYVKAKEECEALLEQMIPEVKERIKEEKREK